MYKKEIIERDGRVVGFYSGNFNLSIYSDEFKKYFEKEGDKTGRKANKVISLLSHQDVDTISILIDLHISKDSRGKRFGNEVLEEVQSMAQISPILLLADIETTPWLVAWYSKVGFELIEGIKINNQPVMILF